MKPLEGKFVELVMKPAEGGRAIKDKDPVAKWIKPLKENHRVNEHFADTVHFQCDTEMIVPHPELCGARGTSSPVQTSFLYLDVGAWIGSADKPWGKEGKIKRDFGIVCGPLVLLCGFEYALSHPQKDGVGNSVSITDSCSDWKNRDKSKEPYRSVNAVLECLSTEAPDEPNIAGHGKLGRAIVREMRKAPGADARYPKDPKQWLVHVIVGDMHIPVLDKEIDTYAGWAESGKRKNLDGTVDAVIAAHPRVPRLGRVDLPALKAVVDRFISSDNPETGLEFLKGFAEVGKRGIDWLVHDGPRNPISDVLTVASGIDRVGDGAVGVAALGDRNGVAHDNMTRADSQAWFEYYFKGVGSKPADIFENAGTQFLQFMKRLATYRDKQAADEKLLDVKFLQLGDMFDFWVGFSCHFTASNNIDRPVQATNPIGENLVKHWAKNLLSNTEQGKLVAEAMELADEKLLNPVYLFGNHDNYMASSPAIEYKPKVFLAPRLRCYSRFGTFMEHGHQWEGSNADNAKVLGVTDYVIGTKSPMGLFVTQAAFVRPSSVRSFEGTAAGLVASATGTYGQRLDQIIGAATRYVAESGAFFCYVMCHTHEACLTNVVFSTPRKDALSRFMDEQNRAGTGKVSITTKGRQFNGKPERFIDPSNAGTTSVEVQWQGMMGDASNEWISLEDPARTPPGAFERAVKGLAARNDKGKESGKILFQDVPPGLYEARYYLTNMAEQPFRSSRQHGPPIAVRGISIQGDAEHTRGRVFEWKKGTGVVGRILLRWAFPSNEFDPNEAWFALYRAEEPNGIIQFGMGGGGVPEALRKKPPHPYRRFSLCAYEDHKTAEAASNAGVWQLDERFMQALSEEPLGKWQLRAFGDLNQQYHLGVVEIEIVPAKPSASRKKKR